MSHPIKYVESNLCAMPSTNVTREFGEPPFFLLANAGGCTPVSKARRAQELGAAGLIVSSKECFCGEDCHSENDDCEHELKRLYDDGSGASIKIPVTRITKGTADNIVKELHHKHTVLMELAWHMPKFEEKIDVEFFYTPQHHRSEDFLGNFSVLAEAFGEQLRVNLRHYIMEGSKLNCGDDTDDPSSPCYQMCTNKGSYCAVNHKVSGKQVVIESLRRMCIHEHQGMDGLWAYIGKFNKLCRDEELFGNTECNEDVFKHANLDQKEIDECMDNAGNVDKDKTNKFLDEAASKSKHHIETPSLYINGIPFTWPLGMTRSIMEVMCSSYEDGKAPHVCYACMGCGDPYLCAGRSPMACHEDDGKPVEPDRSDKSKKSGHHVFRFLFFVALIGGAGGYVYYKKYVEDGEDGLGSYTISHQLLSDTA